MLGVPYPSTAEDSQDETLAQRNGRLDLWQVCMCARWQDATTGCRTRSNSEVAATSPLSVWSASAKEQAMMVLERSKSHAQEVQRRS